jgi:predicted kinase
VLHGADETTRLAADAYTEAASRDVYAVLGRKARLVLAAGHGAVVDAVMIAPEQRAAIEEIARGLGLPFRGIWLEAAPDHLIGRVAARCGDASDATPDVVRRQLARNAGPLGSAWTRVDAGGTADQTLYRARRALACTA